MMQNDADGTNAARTTTTTTKTTKTTKKEKEKGKEKLRMMVSDAVTKKLKARLRKARERTEMLVGLHNEDREFYCIEREATLEVLADTERMLAEETAAKNSLARELESLSARQDASRIASSSFHSTASSLSPSAAMLTPAARRSPNAALALPPSDFSSPPLMSTQAQRSTSPRGPRLESDDDGPTARAQAEVEVLRDEIESFRHESEALRDRIAALTREAAVLKENADASKREAESQHREAEARREEAELWKARAVEAEQRAARAESSGSRDLVAAQREIARLETRAQALQDDLEHTAHERKAEIERWRAHVSVLQEKVQLQRQFMMKAGYEKASTAQTHVPLANMTNNI